MRGFQQLPIELFINEIAPLLDLEDFLALRLVSRRVSSVFSSDGVWKVKLQHLYSQMIDRTLPSVHSYCDHFLQIRRKAQKFECLLLKVKIDEALAMLLRERDTLLPGLLRILAKDRMAYTGLIYDTAECIQILIALTKLKMKPNSSFKISSLDMLEIELASNHDSYCYELSMSYILDDLVENFEYSNFKQLIREHKIKLFVQKVVTRYFQALRKLEETKNKWGKSELLWRKFLLKTGKHITGVALLFSCYNFCVYELSNYGCLEISDHGSRRVFHMKIEFSKFSYKMIEGLNIDPGPRITKVYARNPFSKRDDYFKKRKYLEKVVAEMNSEFCRETKQTVSAKKKSHFMTLRTSGEKGAVLSAISHRSFIHFWFVDGRGYRPTIRCSISKKMSKSKLQMQAGDLVRIKNEYLKVCLGYQTRKDSPLIPRRYRHDDKTVAKTPKTCCLNVHETKFKYVFISKTGEIEHMDDSLREGDIEILRDDSILRQFCDPMIHGPFLRHYNLRIHRFVCRSEKGSLRLSTYRRKSQIVGNT